jgi:WD40 repeat protein
VTRARRIVVPATVATALVAAGAAASTDPRPAVFPGVNGRITFQSNRDRNVEIYSMDARGDDQIRLTTRKAADREPSYSPTADRIVFQRGPGNPLSVWIMNRDGTDQKRLGRAAGDPAMSPDGNTIAFTSDRDGNAEIYVVPTDGSSPAVRLTNNTALDIGPAWSPDGSKIAFASARAGNLEIFVMDPTGANQTRITTQPGPDLEPSWSPDGTRLAFRTGRDGNSEVYVMNADGSNPVNLTTNPAEDRSPAWSPDGSRIAFGTNRDGNTEVYVMNADGTDPTNLTNNPADDGAPDWGVDLPPKQLEDLPRPAVAETANVAPEKGVVLIGIPDVEGDDENAAAAQDTATPVKGFTFVPLSEGRQVPVGSILDAGKGTVELQTAANSSGKRQTAALSAGLFQVLQDRGDKGLTEVRLKGSSFDRCKKKKSKGKGASAAKVSPRTIRRLRANAHGRFRTRGKHSAATVRGTKWIMSDRCDGTLTKVKRGRVVVRDFRRKRSIVVRAGHSYLAKAHR